MNATTGAGSQQSGNLGSNATVYARATQTDVAGQHRHLQHYRPIAG